MSNNRASPGDLLSDTTLTESHLHTHLRSRFYHEINHTHLSGIVLLALNPYTSQTCLDVEEVEQAVEALMCSKQSYLDSQPHVSTLAAFTRACVRWNGENQYIVVHGERDTGKTDVIDSMLHQLLFGDPHVSNSTRRKVFAARFVLGAFDGSRSTRNTSSSSQFSSCIKLNYTSQRNHSAGGVSSSAASSAATAAAASHSFYDSSEQPHQPLSSSISLHSVSFSRLLFKSDRGTVDAIGGRYRYNGLHYPVLHYMVVACREAMIEDTQLPTASSSSSSSSSSLHNDHDNHTIKHIIRSSATLLGLSTNSDR